LVSNKFRVQLSTKSLSVEGTGRTMGQAYAAAVAQAPGHDWRPVFDAARKDLVRATDRMRSEMSSEGLSVTIHRPWA
jgi:hypothetical protein